ncbi:hypothetical protein BV22DRAFT_53076 [Leucogyrophana mollusca]|uniref:Uncharacterized protein n=1 Tax=Leucogyrophana mollusca TaxID=85980 RepID=A0ACB8C0G9_9AGAM|nr:hypothetical protein BV22DRAFT_53076 [Leucogyrophana mollusca]
MHSARQSNTLVDRICHLVCLMTPKRVLAWRKRLGPLGRLILLANWAWLCLVCVLTIGLRLWQVAHLESTQSLRKSFLSFFLMSIIYDALCFVFPIVSCPPHILLITAIPLAEVLWGYLSLTCDLIPLSVPACHASATLRLRLTSGISTDAPKMTQITSLLSIRHAYGTYSGSDVRGVSMYMGGVMR